MDPVLFKAIVKFLNCKILYGGRFCSIDQTSISNFLDFETFLSKVIKREILEKARLSRPNSSWVVEIVSTFTFFLSLK